jgi:CRP-like cAMP-binding protein
VSQMIDLPLFRRSDPISSHEAARKLSKSGKLGTHKRIIFDAIKLWPGETSAFIAEAVDIEPYTVRKRTADLRKSGMVRDNRDTLTKGDELRWWPVL